MAFLLLVQVWHTKVCTAGRKLPWQTRMGTGAWAHLSMVLKNLCGSFLWDEHLRSCSAGSGCLPILTTLPELNGRQGEHGSSSPVWRVQAHSEGDSSQLWYLPLTSVKASFSSWMYIFVTWRFVAAVCRCPAVCVSPSSVISSHIASHWMHPLGQPGLGLVSENHSQCLSLGRSDSGFYFLNCPHWNASWTSRYSMRLA